MRTHIHDLMCACTLALAAEPFVEDSHPLIESELALSHSSSYDLSDFAQSPI